MKGVTVRGASAGETELVSRLIREAFEEFRGRVEPPPAALEETKESIAARLASGAFALVAMVEGEPVGCVLYEPREAYVYLSRLSVLPRYRGRGVAEALMRHVESRAVELGLPRVRLGVRKALPRHRRYYERHGYLCAGERDHPGYPAAAFDILEKDLSAGAGQA